MNREQLQEYARVGAQSRLEAIDDERDEIFKMFPNLRDGARQNGAQPKGRTTRSRTMSAAERRAVGERMRAYWAERRAKKSAGAKKSSAKKAASRAKRQGGMSAEARKAQGERMKAYWAAKRAEKQAAAGEGAQRERGATSNGVSSKESRPKGGRKQSRKR